MRYKIELDTEAQGYYPFFLTGLVLVVGIILFCTNINITQTSDLVNNIYWVAQIAALVIDLLSLRLVFPNEYLMLVQQDTQLEIRYVQKKKIKQIHKVSNIRYCWTHTPSKNHIMLVVVFTDEAEQAVHLTEKLLPWSNPPKWPYIIKSPDKNATQFSCFELEEVVQALKTAGLVK